MVVLLCFISELSPSNRLQRENCGPHNSFTFLDNLMKFGIGIYIGLKQCIICKNGHSPLLSVKLSHLNELN